MELTPLYFAEEETLTLNEHLPLYGFFARHIYGHSCLTSCCEYRVALTFEFFILLHLYILAASEANGFGSEFNQDSRINLPLARMFLVARWAEMFEGGLLMGQD